ncbi:divalent metal cation transporter [Gilvimarinus agarilyticus]|uniref:NRAMP family divalent metal transporter n=1 Tax=unclassified Gilvimarinus TaxID=2642066 RepID=UPI001C0A3C68|nr:MULTISPECIES: divalent metal cation transporter [unclassified Gilvimarinus]MBU2886219.1 divalent metal cation transporter [Gilvimarinus agarilyticus]MDO6570907.1 divalent metal cation transporter [Gilvimarinus sp. 2_MG-2023]MDO6747806.1 divalent metal cation transporter [Gilvimarinus sp. 1_MG-2023]
MSALIKAILSFGPAFLAIGYTIGTGSVTSMIVSGSAFGMQLLWVLMLSCLFSGALIYAYGNFTLVTGETALYSFKKHLKFGKPMAILIIVGVIFGQWNSLIGILGISANIIFEMIAMYFPSVVPHKYEVVMAIAVAVIGFMYAMLLIGRYSIFEKILVIFVSCMGISFILSLFVVHPLPSEVARGLIPVIPDVEGGKMMAAAFVGTTMAAATFLSRPLFIQGKGWTIADSAQQKKDSIVAAFLVFFISGSVMAVASGALHGGGQDVNNVLDMVTALEPIAGKGALTVFIFGTLAAGLSSVFPCMLIAPLLIEDYRSGKLDTQSTQFRVITGIAAVIALTIPVLGFNPIKGQLLTQVFNVFVLPLVILGIILMSNKKNLMDDKSAGVLLNIILGLAFLFSIIISYNGVLALIDL